MCKKVLRQTHIHRPRALFGAGRQWTMVLLAVTWASSGGAAASRADLRPPSPTAIAPSLASVFEPGSFRMQRPDQPTTLFNYRLFKPLPRDSGVRFPLIVWMHGVGEYEIVTHNIGQLKWVRELIFHDLGDTSNYPFYLVAMHCASGDWWSTYGYGGRTWGNFDAIDANIALVEDLMEDYPIDPQRVYVVGISAGGMAGWDMIQRRPTLFAAAAPLGCLPLISEHLSGKANVPVWSFRSTFDRDPPIEAGGPALAQLRELGYRIELTEIGTGDHDCWTAAFSDYHLLEWLLLQTRDGIDCPSPGAVGLANSTRLLYRQIAQVGSFWLHLCVIVGIAALVFIIIREWHRSSRLASAADSDRLEGGSR